MNECLLDSLAMEIRCASLLLLLRQSTTVTVTLAAETQKNLPCDGRKEGKDNGRERLTDWSARPDLRVVAPHRKQINFFGFSILFLHFLPY
jgi:hypothetical protein